MGLFKDLLSSSSSESSKFKIGDFVRVKLILEAGEVINIVENKIAVRLDDIGKVFYYKESEPQNFFKGWLSENNLVILKFVLCHWYAYSKNLIVL